MAITRSQSIAALTLFSIIFQGFRLLLKLITQKSCPSGAPILADAASIEEIPGRISTSISFHFWGPLSIASKITVAIAKIPGSPDETTKTFLLNSKKQEINLIEALKSTCRKFTKEKTGKRPITNINLVRI